MPEHDAFVRAELRTAPIPYLANQDVIAAATQAGRRRVSRRQGAAVGATLAVLAVAGAGLALAAPDDGGAERSLIAKNPSVSHTPPAEATPSSELRNPRGGSHHADILRPLTDRTVNAFTPAPGTTTPPDRGDLPQDVYDLVNADHRRSQTFVGSDLVSVSFLWGLDGLTPAEAEAYKLLPPELIGDASAVDLPKDLMAHCLQQHGHTKPHYLPGTCTEGEDGSVVAEIDHRMKEESTHVRSVFVYHRDGWVQHTESREGGRGEVPDLTDAITLADLRQFTFEGDWWE